MVSPPGRPPQSSVHPTAPSGEWDGAYQRESAPPWDIGRPQRAFLALADRGLLTGSLLDAGCGTGEHALLAAAHGAGALGVDLSSVAVARARAKAADRGVAARFESGDILTMPLPDAGFDTVVDSGLFHVFDDADRARYVDALARVLRPGGFCYLMCFSDRQPGDWGPRRVARDEIDAGFADGWTIRSVREAAFEVTSMPDVPVVQAWLATIRRD